ncbi:MAG: hydroxyacid dehydrogenase, partial [Lachnospiraceae bacterium]|nr:hydroxyacid dehydrogenase [Lachnospiraceae bacterium]
MKLVLLDRSTLGEDVPLTMFEAFGELTVWQTSSPEEIPARVKDADVILTNKCRLNARTLSGAEKLKLICVAATGYDNIDLAYCREKGIGATNVVGYSTDSVAQLTFTLALALVMHLPDFTAFVENGSYTASGVANRLFPAFHELRGRTWGVVGAGNIGQQVARVAEAFGCRVVVNRRKADPVYETLPLEELLRESDIVSLHVPLSDATRGMIGRKELALMKKDALLINVARGAVTDEEAVAEAVLEGRIGGLGVDVYSQEPFPADHPYQKIVGRPGVILTPH